MIPKTKTPLLLLALVFLSLTGGCDGNSGGVREVVVYTALDRSFSEPTFKEFTRRTGILVRARFDTESTKTVGLAQKILAEKARPRCDIFWNNEILNTLRLKKAGVLASYQPREAAKFPAAYRDPDGYWYGFAARARVIIVNKDIVPDPAFPTSIRDLADPRWKGKIALAKPLFGTTASHVTCLMLAWGREGMVDYLKALRRNNVQIQGGNKGCAQAVARGDAAFALTDTDDAIIEVDAGKPVRIVYPDGGADQTGTLFLPNTLGLVKGGPNPETAMELINFLLTAEVEERLAAGASAQIPLHKDAKPNRRVKGPREVRAMTVEFEKAAKIFTEALSAAEAALEGEGA